MSLFEYMMKDENEKVWGFFVYLIFLAIMTWKFPDNISILAKYGFWGLLVLVTKDVTKWIEFFKK